MNADQAIDKPVSRWLRIILHLAVVGVLCAAAFVSTSIGRTSGYRTVGVIMLQPWVPPTIGIAFLGTVMAMSGYAWRRYHWLMVLLPIPGILIAPLLVGILFHLLSEPITVKYVCVSIAIGIGLVAASPRSERLFARWFVALVLLSLPAVIFGGIATNIGGWTCHGMVTTGGQTYAFLDSSFLQGQTMALGRRRAINLFWTEWDMLGENNGDSPRSYALVVRTNQAVDGYGQLYLTPDNCLVGIRYENNAYLYYDISADRFIGHGPIEELSPFVLLDTTTAPCAGDIEATVKWIGEAARGSENERIPPKVALVRAGVPRQSVLEAALAHPNPAVRDAAAKMLEARQAVADE